MNMTSIRVVPATVHAGRQCATIARWMLATACATCPLQLSAQPAEPTYPKLAPFTAVEWDGDQPRAKINGTWYIVLKIDGRATADIVKHCREKHGGKWKKRFAEDLVQVLTEMGRAPADAVDITVRETADPKPRVLRAVPMTMANRHAIIDAGDKPRPADRHRDPAARHTQAQLTSAQIREDLAQLRDHIHSHFSYLDRCNTDLGAAITKIETLSGKSLTVAAFAIEVQKLVATLNDGHSGVDLFERYLPSVYLPLLPGACAERIAAIRPDHGALLDADHPYLRSIDDKPIAQWLAAAARITPAPSRRFSHHNSVKNLRLLGFLRQELKLPAANSVSLELEDASGASLKQIQLPTAAQRPLYGQWPRGGHRTLPGGISYIRLASMDDDPAFLNSLREALVAAASASRVIIDVRGNGGGKRNALLMIFPCLMSPSEPPVVVNAAVLRQDATDATSPPDGLLQDRFMYPRSWPDWTDPQRAAISAFATSFSPQWIPPKNKFSEWHYLVLSRGDKPAAELHNKPITVLMNTDCFSATDIFLGAMKTRKNVKLMGTPSGGGSGRPQPVRLRHSGVVVSLSTMASFAPDGALYDGNGITPHTTVDAAPGDWIGTTDSMLDLATKSR